LLGGITLENFFRSLGVANGACLFFLFRVLDGISGFFLFLICVYP
jgi:hypothetical protein